MALRRGKCTNFSGCELANRGELSNVPEAAPFVCPRCARALEPVGPQRRLGDALLLGLTLLLLSLLAVLGWRSCSARLPQAIFHKGGPAAQPGRPSLTLAGSNTIGASLAPALAEAFLQQMGAVAVRTLPGSDESTVEGTLPGDSGPTVIHVEARGSSTAFTSLAAGGADIGMASRRIRADEAASLASLGNMQSAACEHVLGLDGVAVIVNEANPLRTLTMEQLRAIFAGEATNWSAVHGASGSIHIKARDDKSGTWDTFRNLVLRGASLAADAQRFEDSTALSDAVAADPNAIGFVGLPYVHSARALAVADRGATALLPTRLTVATEDYPLSRRLYLYTAASPRNALVHRFIEFALSRRGQEVVAAGGFVEQNVAEQRETAAADAPADYRKLTAGAERLTLDFRFQTGTAALDNKAAVDIGRVVGFIADLKYSGDRVMLFGFADSTGTRDRNVALSQARAKAVEAEFTQRGVEPSIVRGFGPELPVASNDTADGREKNRRVEIWIRSR